MSYDVFSFEAKGDLYVLLPVILPEWLRLKRAKVPQPLPTPKFTTEMVQILVRKPGFWGGQTHNFLDATYLDIIECSSWNTASSAKARNNPRNPGLRRTTRHFPKFPTKSRGYSVLYTEKNTHHSQRNLAMFIHFQGLKLDFV